MKKIYLLCFLTVCISCNSQDKRALVGETEYQQKENSRFKDASKSPLDKKDLKNFKGLEFFPIDSTFIVNATFTKIVDAPIFEMATTTDRKPLYKKYGVLNFIINGKELQLTIYQSQSNLASEEYEDYLFLPFTDDTSGEDSYGGGRYMDVMISDINKDGTVALNFNNTYNPYCAYSDRYSCPLTPRKNHLDIEINAGIKVFKKH
ncbi:hypothetical protein OD91_1057 [Lutibacter sp. Hel_I_33_5]|uniref:DUF1684 domain-containing protein n=1 Tax=Lutibacter sp. Hel_I_33_5 TaxID=1566289 RepID=UPI0011A7117A|nr:DUF1684 domain-containing protein [Lutibacter sp. Hel_I_33_5]TVZ55790.1 hypothetical protein OD91_1057 [Lutibacter sp. Hel_I_33_5]